MKKVILPVLFILVLFVFRNIFNPSVYLPTPLEVDRTVTRQEYLGDGLGKIYKNRFGVTFFNKIYPTQMKFESIFFADLGSGFVFIPLFGSLLYFGYKKFR